VPGHWPALLAAVSFLVLEKPHKRFQQQNIWQMKLPPGHQPGAAFSKPTAYGGFGQKMLEQMGWSKGQGLGKEKSGMKEAIEVKKKEDTLGVRYCATPLARFRHFVDAVASLLVPCFGENDYLVFQNPSTLLIPSHLIIAFQKAFNSWCCPAYVCLLFIALSY